MFGHWNVQAVSQWHSRAAQAAAPPPTLLAHQAGQGKAEAGDGAGLPVLGAAHAAGHVDGEAPGAGGLAGGCAWGRGRSRGRSRHSAHGTGRHLRRCRRSGAPSCHHGSVLLAQHAQQAQAGVL